MHITSENTEFDTVIAVYTDDNGTPGEQVACVDDIPSAGPEYPWQSQAEVTVATEAGVQFLVQVGGFSAFGDPNESEFGTVVIALA